MIKDLFQNIVLVTAFFLLSSLTGSKKSDHPIYVSVAEINYDNNDRFATVLCKIFSDDLDLALRRLYPATDNSGKQDSKEFPARMESYIKTHLLLKINGTAENLLFTNYRKEDNALIVNFRINDVDTIQRFEIADTIFYELYDKQIQVVYVTVNGNRKNGRVSNPESKLAFNF